MHPIMTASPELMLKHMSLLALAAHVAACTASYEARVESERNAPAIADEVFAPAGCETVAVPS